jgi:hypothetical protein
MVSFYACVARGKRYCDFLNICARAHIFQDAKNAFDILLQLVYHIPSSQICQASMSCAPCVKPILPDSQPFGQPAPTGVFVPAGYFLYAKGLWISQN